jgi:hypothetical protein
VVHHPAVTHPAASTSSGVSSEPAVTHSYSSPQRTYVAPASSSSSSGSSDSGGGSGASSLPPVL